jgi:7-carboxy-7-deazaguanine synthase
MNRQIIEKITADPNGDIDVHSIFYTIQGEGPLAGHPAIFLRLAGCNLQCPHCDTEYTKGRKLLSNSEILVKLYNERADCKFVVITGGEPFRQRSLGNLVTLLQATGYKVQIETNGTLFTPGPWASTVIVCSPKTSKIDDRLAPYITALKYVVDDQGVSDLDGLPIHVMGYTGKTQVARPPKGFKGLIYLQPLDYGNSILNDVSITEAVDSCLKYGHKLCLQIHKLVDLP